MRNRIPKSVACAIRQLTLAALFVLVGCEAQVSAPTTNESGRVKSGMATATSPVATDSKVTGGVTDKPQSAPRIEVGSTRHDFGEMNPYQFGQHEFVVRNVGDAPLELRSGGSSCSCTFVEIPEEPLPPDERRTIVLGWETKTNNRRFEEYAMIATNDPRQPSLKFTVTGDVLVHVGANPSELIVPGIHPSKGAAVTTVISSQVWDDFRIENLDCSMKGYQWSLSPATSAQLDKLKARSGQQLTIHIPSSLPEGGFHEWVRFHIVPPDPDATSKLYELPLRGRVLRRLAVYGPGIDYTGRVSLGVVKSQQGLRRRLVMKVRDPDPELRIQRVSCHPSFLQINVTPFATETNIKGLYYLDIEIPPSSPAGRFRAKEAGEITIHFDHPRISNLELKVDFAVSSHHRGPLSNQQSADQLTHGVLTRRTNR